MVSRCMKVVSITGNDNGIRDSRSGERTAHSFVIKWLDLLVHHLYRMSLSYMLLALGDRSK